MRLNRRTFLKATGSTALLGAAASGSASAADPAVVDNAPVVADAKYPTMGTDGSNPTATVYGNFKCPHTREFVINNLTAVVREFVETGRLNLRFRTVAYEPDPSDPSHGSSVWYISSSDPRISETALAGWAVDPDDYWAFFLDMFQNQVSGYVTRGEVVDRMAAAGMDGLSTVRSVADRDYYDNAVRASANAAEAAGIRWTPWMEFQGDTISPHHDLDTVRRWLDARAPAAGSSGSSSGSSGGSASASSVSGAEVGGAIVRQYGRTDWDTQSLARSYDDPVAVMKGLSSWGGQPAHVRLKDVSAGSFDYQIEEWMYLDGAHTAEATGYVVAERGVQSVDGATLEAGTVRTDEQFARATLSGSFSGTPVVLAQSQTYNGSHSIVTRLHDVSANGFDVRLQEEEAQGTHKVEEVGYLALEPGVYDVGGQRVEVGTVAAGSGWSQVSFRNRFSAPRVLADLQTYNGSNTAEVRYTNLGRGSVNVRVAEEQSADAEIGHKTERVGYVVVETA